MQSKLRAKRDALEELWHQGLSGRALLQKHTSLIDDHLAELFTACKAASKGMALVALGGYGRRELFPFSDIDLLLLYAPSAKKHLAAVTEAVFYPLWDAGLEVGHGVRTIDACMKDADNDFFFQVALLDSRLITGPQSLFDELQQSFKSRFVEGRRQEFLENMLAHRAERHRRFGMHGYQLEPHIKESRGGFRDIQSMLWTSQVVYGLKSAGDLQEAGLLTPQEREDFDKACDNLVRIRNRLHFISGRKNDQLFFEHQQDMAEAFRYRDTQGVLGVELFMREVYSHMQKIATITDLYFEHTDETLNKSAQHGLRSLESGIVVKHDRISISDRDLLQKKPHMLMRVFLHAAREGLPIHHHTQKLVTANLHLIDDALRNSKRMSQPFFEILQQAENPLTVLSTMLETGMLTAYIPELQQVESLAQHDVYHVFTVDRHLLQAVVEMQRLAEENSAYLQVSAPHVLFLATLLHDIGKGRTRDHSELGAELARTIAKRLHLTVEESNCLVFLVREHLFLTVTALRRDLEDHALLLQCAEKIQDTNRLHMLYLLSIADARATGPTVWNEWKAALLLDLYLKIAHLLDHQQEPTATEKEQGVAWMLDRIRELLPAGEKANLTMLPEEYVLSFTPEDIADHIQLRRELTLNSCLLRHAKKTGYWSLFAMATDRTGLLARICGALALHNLDVVSAQIFTWEDGTAVDVLNVHSTVDMRYEDQDWQALRHDLNRAITNRIGLDHRLQDKRLTNVLSAKQTKLPRPPRVVINNDLSPKYTIIEVYATDHPGLLYHITKTLADFEISICRAKIGTERDQVVDVFYTLKANGRKIEEKDLKEEISKALLYIASVSPAPAKPAWRNTALQIEI